MLGALVLTLGSCVGAPTPEQASDMVLVLREYGAWAWAIGIGLIWADAFLPVPQTSVIAALGIVYGPVLGGLVGSIGLVSGGLIGYGLMFTAARRFAPRFVGPKTLQKVESLSDKGGAWAIVLSRSFSHSIPEAIVFLAGLARMPIKKFIIALTLGSVPVGFAFAAIGAGLADRPLLALIVSYVIPILLLPIALYLARRRAPRS
jgi:uncharacterized membrane protein YdjX (TVP38/TMEM64 family)